MVSQLDNELTCIRHYRGVNGQSIIAMNVCVDDWTAESAIIASNFEIQMVTP